MSEEETTPAARETFGHPITMELGGADLERKNEEHIKVCNDLEEIEGRKRTAMSGFNEELKLKRKQEISLRAIINSKSMQVEVNAYSERDDRRGMMLTRRVDTGEVVDERALTAEERGQTPDDRQGNLFADKSAAPALPEDGSEPEEAADADAESALDGYAALQAESDDDDDSDIGDESEDAVAH